MLSLEWLRTFIAVYQSGTTTAAAELLNKTQPGVSNHIAALESAVGAKLFDRTARRMLPTEKGKELYSWLIEPMEKLDLIENRLKNFSRPVMPVVRIGSPIEYFHFLALEKIRGADVRFHIHFDVTETLLAQLERKELDIVISTRRTVNKEWQCDFLMEENFVLISPKDFPVVDPSMRPEEIEALLARQRWVVYGPELPALRRYWKINFRKRPFIDPVLILPNYLTMVKAVRLGFGIAVAPDYLCRDGLRRKDIILPWKNQSKAANQLYLIYHKSFRNVLSIANVAAALTGALPIN